jgi:hypothetical protein
VQENKRLSCLKEEHEEQLLALEKAARILGEQEENGKEDMKSMENNHIISQETLADTNLRSSWPSCKMTT